MKKLLAMAVKAIASIKDTFLCCELLNIGLMESVGDKLYVDPADVHTLVLVVEKTILTAFLRSYEGGGQDETINVTVEISMASHICLWTFSFPYADFCYEAPWNVPMMLRQQREKVKEQLTCALRDMLNAHRDNTIRKVGNGYEIHRRY